MKRTLLACLLLLCIGLKGFGQVTADPALDPVFFTTLANNPLASTSLPLNGGLKINVPFLNKSTTTALPAGSCKLKIGLGSKLQMNPGFNIATAPFSQYFSWSVALAGGQWQITGDLIADLPASFSGVAAFELTGIIVGNSTVTGNFLVTNHNTTTILSDSDGTNNNATQTYTVVSAVSISIDQGTAITVCQNASLTLTTTTLGTGPFTYLWTGGLGTASSATPPTTSIGTTSYTVTVTDGSSNTANATISVTVSGPNNITASAGANGSISSSGVTSVPCGTNKTYTITPNACYHVADVLVDGVSVGAVTSYTFTNVTTTHTISASFAINTFTITVNAGANGAITPATGTVNCGSNNTYTITPNTCYHIVSVTLDGVSQGAVTTLNVNNVSANHTVAATFAVNTFTITVNPGANGTITPATGPVNCGSNNTYTISPNACYHVLDVTLDGVSQGAVTTLNVNNVTANHTIAATFALNTFTITVNPGVNGTITPGTGTVNCGSNNTYTIAANACYHILDVTLDGVSQGIVTTLNLNNVTANHTIAATFAINTFTITVNPGANGTITPATGPVNCGSNNTYTIAANSCFHIVDVTLDGVSQGAVTTLNVNNTTANHTIAATFAANTFTIVASAGTGGSISPSGATIASCGSNKTFTITPAACFAVLDVLVDGVSQGAITTYTFTNITTTHTISATFATTTYTITVNAGANGTVTPGTGTVNCGSNNTYSIAANACYHIVDVTLDGISQGPVTTLSVNNVTANHTIAATFAINTFTITVNAGANGTVTPGTGTVNCGSNNTYTIAANACYHIVDVTLDGISQGPVTTLNVNNVSANHTIAATFAINTFTITVNAGANGTITPGTGTVSCGSNNTYSIAANACYHIVDVTLDGISQGPVTTLSVNNVSANHTIAATFAINTFTITVNAGANGTVTPGTGTVNCGSNNAYTIAANACYHIVDVTLDGVSQGAVTTLNVNNVSANHTIAATFAINTFTITVNAGANGTITPGTGTVNCGSNNAYTIAANACYHIVDVTLDGVSQGPVTTLNVNNVSANHTIAASFAINTFTITVNAGANGTVTPGTGTVNCGSNNTYTIAANACYHIVDVTLDGVSQGPVTSLNINNISANHTIAATFAINTFTITVNAGANGTITPGTGTVNCGSNNTYTIAANACYHIVDVTLDGISQGAVTSLNVNNVTANHTIAATFALTTYTITVNAGANGTVTPGTGTVNCGSNNTYIIAANACYHIVDVTLDGISQGPVTTLNVNNVSANHTIAATFAINTFTITVNAGTNGTITPGTGTVNCGSNNTYTIAANACYHIVDVTLDGISQGPVTSLNINNVSANHTIAATFAINTYTITVNAGANGTITPGTGTVNCGSNNIYTITANACYHIVDVTLDGISQGPVTSLNINNVSASHTITATFALTTYTITVNAGANGTVTPGTATVNCGSNNTYTIAANSCYHIVDVTLDGISQGPVTSLNINNVSASHTIAATFAINTYTITVNAAANGTVTPGTGTVNCGSNNTYTIAANACYHIVDVTLDGVSQGPVTTLSINNVNADHTIAATFAINTYTITINAGANGTITPGTGTVNCGSNNAYTITPDACYHIVDVTLDGVSQGPITTLNINNVAANHTIAATFATGTSTITATAGPNGTVTPAGITTVNCGGSQAYVITADPGYHIVDVLVDGVSVGAVAAYTYSNVTANHTISATFAIDMHTITATSGANGTVTPAGATQVANGSNQSYAITAASCYSVLDVLVDGISVGAVTSYTFSNVTTDHTISATFILSSYSITATTGANGTVTPAGIVIVNCGTNNTYTITPNTCYHVDDVLVDGVSVGAVTSYTFTNTIANHTISAGFALNTYTVTVNAGANGTVTPGTGTVNCSSNNTYAIAANACYHIADVTLDGVSQGPVTSLTINNITADHTIAATFAIDTYTITANAGANGTITPGTGTVNCGSNNTYTIAANTCYHVVDVTLDGVSQGAVTSLNINNVSANHTIAATFAINAYTITVNAGANGTITPGTGTVNCGSNNTYAIAANACYHIVDVTLDGVSQGPVTSLNVNNINADHTIAATFAINTYTITVNAGANGTITPGTGTVNCGSNNTYTIAANACYHIVDVTLDGVSQGAVTGFNVNNVSANHTIAATFAINTFTITVNAGANGTITPGTGTVNCGSNNTYTIAADACYHIVDVTLDGVSQGPVTSLNLNNVSADHTIAATFALTTYTITVNAGANGTITPGTGTVNCGSNNTYTIAANTCYHIVDVTLDGVSQGPVTSLNVNNINADHTIAATFAINTYTITVNAGANGTITPGTGTVNCGSNNTYTIAANACYHIVDVTLDGVSQGAVTGLNVNNVSANHTIAATFAINTFTITVNAGANGSITPGTGTVNCGSNNTYTIAANACYHIVDVTLDGISQGPATTLNVNNVSANHTIAATFAINTFTITVNAGANGTITPGTGTVNCGSNNTYTITANTCYHILDVTLDGVSQGAVTGLNVNNTAADHTIVATFAADIIPVPSVAVVDNCNGTSTLTASGYTGSLLWSDGGTGNPHIVTLAGTYTVTQTIGSCTSNSSLPANANPASLSTPDVTITQPNCAIQTGTITVTAPTGAGITYSIDGLTYTNTTGVFAGLSSGPYNVTAKAAGGCISNIRVAVVNAAPAATTLSLSSIVNNTCHGGGTGMITVTASGATGPYIYTIISGPTINTTGQTNGIFTALSAGNYVISVSPAVGCSSSIPATVTEPSGIVPDISLGADYTGNFFALIGDENTLVYNISEIGGNPAVGDTLRIIKVPGFSLLYDPNATTTSIGSTNYILDNQRWKLDNSNPSFISIIFDPANNNTAGIMSCSSRLYVSIRFKRTTLNASTFSLTSRLRKTNTETHLNNNLAPVLFTAE